MFAESTPPELILQIFSAVLFFGAVVFRCCGLSLTTDHDIAGRMVKYALGGRTQQQMVYGTAGITVYNDKVGLHFIRSSDNFIPRITHKNVHRLVEQTGGFGCCTNFCCGLCLDVLSQRRKPWL